MRRPFRIVFILSAVLPPLLLAQPPAVGLEAPISVPQIEGTGTIRGVARDDISNRGIPWVQVQIFKEGETSSWIQVLTNLQGAYETSVAPGTYVLHAVPPYSLLRDYQAEWYDNAADRAAATPVQVGDGGVAEANFSLGSAPIDLHGTISGTVIDEVTSAPLQGVLIILFQTVAPSNSVASAITDAQGHYSVALGPGAYLVRAEPLITSQGCHLYKGEWYDNVSDPSKATFVDVVSQGSATADFALTPITLPAMASIEGKVVDAHGLPIAQATVVLMRTLQEMLSAGSATAWTADAPDEVTDVEGVGPCHGVVWKGVTDDAGKFLALVPKGKQYLGLASKAGFQPAYYLNQTNPYLADLIDAASSCTGIDFSLGALTSLAGSILNGVVRDVQGTGVASRVVLLPVLDGAHPHGPLFVHTDADGHFTFRNVSAGKCLLLALPFGGFAPAFCGPAGVESFEWQKAEPLTVVSDLSGVVITVPPLGFHGPACVTGTVKSSGGVPLASTRILATMAPDVAVGYAVSDPLGSYTLERVVTGQIEVVADHEGFASSNRTVNLESYSAENVDFILTPVTATSVPERENVPRSFQLHQNYPNPFNPSTRIGFDLPVGGAVHLGVYNLLGEEIVVLMDGVLPAGGQSVTWDGVDIRGHQVSAGMYLYRLDLFPLEAGPSFSEVRRMVLVK